jgi:hypothetical protein
MTEHESRAAMFEQELLNRHEKTSLAEIKRDQLESFRYQGNIQVYDPAFHILKDQWFKAVAETRAALQPSALEPVAAVSELPAKSHWLGKVLAKFTKG